MTNDATARQAMRLYCAQHDTTQTQVAYELGIDQGLFSKLINCVIRPTETQVEQILKKTGIDLREYQQVSA